MLEDEVIACAEDERRKESLSCLSNIGTAIVKGRYNDWCPCTDVNRTGYGIIFNPVNYPLKKSGLLQWVGGFNPCSDP